jgi:murein DD-endopeptidase MepM/ murein hydrolase activator NlpD
MTQLHHLLKKYENLFQRVVPFNPEKDALLQLDFTAHNPLLNEEMLINTTAFSSYIDTLLSTRYLYGIGGYNEHRMIYSRSRWFDDEEEPRRLHLGIDIWGKARTPIFAPLPGIVHSFAFNNNFGDYGATIILQHQLDGFYFQTLYGHLSLNDIAGLQEGKFIPVGTQFAHFGEPEENGGWPPHVHFQIIREMNQGKGDYPGVCRFSERNQYLLNSPDPDLILHMMQYAVKD